jgi:hypothetical protein
MFNALTDEQARRYGYDKLRMSPPGSRTRPRDKWSRMYLDDLSKAFPDNAKDAFVTDSDTPIAETYLRWIARGLLPNHAQAKATVDANFKYTMGGDLELTFSESETPKELAAKAAPIESTTITREEFQTAMNIFKRIESKLENTKGTK